MLSRTILKTKKEQVWLFINISLILLSLALDTSAYLLGIGYRDDAAFTGFWKASMAGGAQIFFQGFELAHNPANNLVTLTGLNTEILGLELAGPSISGKLKSN